MSYSISIKPLRDSPPNDGERWLNVMNHIIDLDANTNEESLTNESTSGTEVVNE